MVTLLVAKRFCPVKRGMSCDRPGADLARLGQPEVETLHPHTNFFPFFRPSQKSPCLAPARKLDCRTTQGPYRFHRLEETLGCDSLRGPARLRSRAESYPALRADLVYLAFALEIQGFCDVAPRKPCLEILSSSIVTFVKPASL